MGMGFFGSEFLTFLSEQMLTSIADQFAGKTWEDVYDEIKVLEGPGGYVDFVDDYLDYMLIGATKFLTIYGYFETYSGFKDAVENTIQAMDDYRDCINLDMAFVRLWCGDMSDFPHNWNYEEELEDICRNWEENCGNLNSDFFIQSGFGLNSINRGRLCNECRYEWGWGEGEIPWDASSDDYDGDGVPNSIDLCDCHPDSDNADNIGPSGYGSDGIGDACQDVDGDGFLDGGENPDLCHWRFSEENVDLDANGIGDACEKDEYEYLSIEDCFIDSDGDGIVDCLDNCPNLPYASPDDRDNDGVGDDCDNCPDFWNPNQSIAPCEVPDPTLLDSTCTPEEIENELAVYNHVIDCIVMAGTQHTPPPPVVEVVSIDPDTKQPRACILQNISQQLGQEVLCEYWEHNPAWVISGVFIVPYFGNTYDPTCGEVNEIDIDDDEAAIIDAIQHCCKSTYMLGPIQENINTLRNILACIPNPKPTPHCIDVKMSLTQLENMYQSQLDYWLLRRDQTEARINNGYCN